MLWRTRIGPMSGRCYHYRLVRFLSDYGMSMGRKPYLIPIVLSLFLQSLREMFGKLCDSLTAFIVNHGDRRLVTAVIVIGDKLLNPIPEILIMLSVNCSTTGNLLCAVQYMITETQISRNLVHPLPSVAIVQSFGNFAQSTVVSLPCSVQNFKKIGQLRNKLRANKTSQNLSLRCVSGGCPILHKAPGLT